MTDFIPWLTLVPLFLATGSIAGLLAGLLGIGGGIVIVPVLYWMTDFGLLDVGKTVVMHFAVATSLTTIIPTSISSTLAHHKKRAVDFALFKAWGPYIVLGSFLGGGIALFLDGSFLKGLFAIIAILVLINMLNPYAITLKTHPPTSILGRAAIAMPIGGFSVWLGIGGGSFSVPTLTLMSFPVHRAVGTAALFGLLIAIPGTLSYATAGQSIPGLLPNSLGFINIPAALTISIASFACAPLGARLAHFLNSLWLKRVFALFLATSALKMLYGFI